eukprot:TRINITY_DN14114_c0_g2_i1.p3 TRINITY_DN14114_c0_g2~~TRINITY_DN14114_c0_g2_i1.p3  ORF type:complete len:183 (-),score=21.12 TRINITY_DN14114_c0_g2_i1:21-569(-)
MFKFLRGGFAQKYNFLKKRSGAFWADRFHFIRIQNGEHLGRCLFYIDMNMVRAGTVEHPAEWKHTAFHEFVGNRERYKIVNMDKLLKILGIPSYDEFLTWYKKTLTNKVSCNLHSREAYWSKAFAVGSEEWLCLNTENMKRMQIYMALKNCFSKDMRVKYNKLNLDNGIIRIRPQCKIMENI